MIILGQIQQVTKQVMKDKKDASKPEGVMYQLVIADKCKPSNFRTTTPFVTWLSEDKMVERFKTAEAMEDADVTLIAKEVGQYNAFLKVKGDVFAGHHAADALARLQSGTPAPLPTKPQSK